MNWYVQVFKKYAAFSGRSRRSEFWFFALYNALVLLAFKIGYLISLGYGTSHLQHKSQHATPSMLGLGAIALAVLISLLLVIYLVGVIIPSLAVTVRRLHDTGRRAWWLLFGLIPMIGAIVLFIFMLLGSKPTENRYGPSPKVLPAV